MTRKPEPRRSLSSAWTGASYARTGTTSVSWSWRPWPVQPPGAGRRGDRRTCRAASPGGRCCWRAADLHEPQRAGGTGAARGTGLGPGNLIVVLTTSVCAGRVRCGRAGARAAPRTESVLSTPAPTISCGATGDRRGADAGRQGRVRPSDFAAEQAAELEEMIGKGQRRHIDTERALPKLWRCITHDEARRP